jgi:HK97 family phage major capsid protein
MADELELIEGLVQNFEEFKTKNKKDREDLVNQIKDLAGKDFKELKEKAENDAKELREKLEQVNTEIAAKGATVQQLMDEVEEFKKKKGRFTVEAAENGESTVSLLKDAWKNNAAQLEVQAKKPKSQMEFELKDAGTMTASANLTGSVVASYAAQPALRGRRKLHIRDLIDVIPSGTGVWKFYRQNTPPGEGSFQSQTTHGALKSQLDYDMTEVTITVDFLAGFVRIAKQMLADLPFMQSFVSNELVEDYLRAEDNKFFGQIYSGATGNAASSSSTVSVEKVIDYIAALGENDYEANGAVVTHAVWAKILKTKPADYSLPAGNAVTVDGNGNVTIVGVPILRTNESNIGANRILIGDWTKAKIIQAEGLSVNIYEQDSDNVQRNLVTIKAEARVALALLRPDAFIWGTAGTT